MSARPPVHLPASRAKTVLLATAGLSPAVLTETVWALSREQPPVIPDAVIVITTGSGARRIKEQLFGEDEIWRQLRVALLGRDAATDPRLDFDTTPDRLKVVTCRRGDRRQPLDELTTREQNNAFADAVTQELWTHTSQTDVRVIASLAGGFKTMGALMLSAMQLMSNHGDRVTHVLASGGFEHTEPPFFFPAQRNQKLLRQHDRVTLRAAAAAKHIRLVDVPVIPLRRWFEEVLNRKPPSYETLVEGSTAALQHAASDCMLELGPREIPEGERKHWLVLAGTRHALSPDQYAYLRFFAERALADSKPAERPMDLLEELMEWVAGAKDIEPRFHRMFEGLHRVATPRRKEFNADSLSKRMNGLRGFLRKLPGGSALAATLPGKGHWGLHLGSDRIRLH